MGTIKLDCICVPYVDRERAGGKNDQRENIDQDAPEYQKQEITLYYLVLPKFC